jgi:hypothetical protein
MSIAWADNFTRYPVGAITPFGAWTGWNSGGGIVIGSGPNPGEKGVAVGDISTFGPGLLGVLTFFMGVSIGPTTVAGPILVLANTNPLNILQNVILVTLRLEPDRSLTIVGPGAELGTSYPLLDSNKIPANTIAQGDPSYPPVVMNENDYYYIALTASLFAAALDDPVTISGTLQMQGVTVCNGGAIAPFTWRDLPEIAFAPSFNRYEISLYDGISGNIANVAVDSSPLAPYPNPVPPKTLFARLSQLAIEPLEQPSNANVRMSQMGLEVLALPSQSNVRLSQFVIELLSNNPGGSPGSKQWLVKEC